MSRCLLVTLLLAAPLAGQTVTPARSCDKPDVTAGWYKMQADWWALDAKHDWTNDSLRTALVEIGKMLEPRYTGPFPLQLGAQSTRLDAPEYMVPKLPPADQFKLVKDQLRQMAQKRTWPTRSLVGVAGTHAAWLIISTDTALATAGLHAMMEAGPEESSAFDVAIMEDQLRLGKGRKQLYASQILASRQPAPTEDLLHVDMRRDAAGLPPLAWALCAVGKKP